MIGGGITGLAAAHRVLERCHESGRQVDLTLLEASGRVGGIVQTHERDGFLLESGPDSFISEKPAALELARRLGLETNLIETSDNHRRSFVVRRGRLRPVPRGFHLLAPGELWPFVKSDIFSWRGKARMAMDLVLPRRNTNGAAEESLADFVRRRLGSEALERMAQPMIGGIYTADPEKLSLRATMPRFLEMEHEHRSLIRALRKQSRSPIVREGVAAGTSGARYSLFLSFDRGMQLFTDKLAERISGLKFKLMADGAQSAGSIRVNTAVEALALENPDGRMQPTWTIRTRRGETLAADALCLALPAYACAELLGTVDEQLATELDGISCASSATLNLAYKRDDIPHPLDGFGFVVPFIENRSIIACTFSSVKFTGRAPGGRVLLRSFIGGALQPKMLDLTEAALLARVRNDLRDLLGIEAAPLFTELQKWDRSMPQYHVGHLDRVRRMQERVNSLPGLALAGNAFSGPGLPDCIRSGEAAADEIVASLTPSISSKPSR
ncbi:MAG: protoporphyrinogen oxidase [Pyrinomonadaceae bacterium]|nr:protoporphyrinogen oxidase [Pyrinomonadaceae bacterium]